MNRGMIEALRKKRAYREGLMGRSSSDYTLMRELGVRIDGHGEEVPEAQRFVEDLEDTDLRIARLETRTSSVDAMREVLTCMPDALAEDLLRVLDGYMSGKLSAEVAETAHLSRRAYSRRRLYLVYLMTRLEWAR